MTPINEFKEEEYSSNHDAEQIDALWATFRLPIPIASNERHESSDGGSSYSDSHHDEWLLQALELLRLLHTMEDQHANPNILKNTGASKTSRERERIMESQMMLAYSMLEKAERAFPSLQEGENKEDEANDRFHQNCHRLMQKLRYDAEQTCAKFRGWLERQSLGRQQMPQERDIIYDIFFAPADEGQSPANNGDDHSEILDDFDEDEEEDYYEDDDVANRKSIPAQRHRQQQPVARQPKEVAAVDPVEFQKQQQELLELELADMAKSLKSSTLNMNKTLQTQTRELGDMEELAERNLETVTNTAKDVENRLKKKKGWKKQLATWSLIGTVIGMWVLCFMIMRTVPKRRVTGKMPDFVGMAKGGANAIRKTWEGLFADDETKLADDENRYDAYEEAQEMARQRHEQNRRKEELQRRQQGQQEEECEVLPDGRQVCSKPKSEADRTAQELAAERRRRRIEENMANAPIVEAVDSFEEKRHSGHDADRYGEDEDSSNDDEDSSSDPMGCIQPIEEMHVHQRALDSLSKALGGITDAINRAPDGSTQQMQMERQFEKLQLEVKKHTSALEAGKNKARSTFWVDRENRVKARIHSRALGSIQFCEEGDNVSQHEEKDTRQEKYAARQREDHVRLETERKEKFREEAKRAEEAQKQAEAEMKRLEQERAENERRETESRQRQERMAAEERALRQKNETRVKQEQLAAAAWHAALEKRRQEQLEQGRQEKLVAETKRMEEERLASEAEESRLEQQRVANEIAKRAALEKLEQERLEVERVLAEQKRQEEEEARQLAALQEAVAVRLEQERQAEAAGQAELAKLEQERLEQERILTEERQKEEEEARQLAEEEAKRERLEHARLAAEAAKEEELARQIANAIAKAEAGAKAAMGQSEHIAADNAEFSSYDVRFAAGRLKNDMLAHYISTSPEMVDASDRGGWHPIHEAARAGNLAGIQLLASAGCDLTSRTGRTGNGGTALWWAIQRFGEDHDAVRLLRSHGAIEAGPV